MANPYNADGSLKTPPGGGFSFADALESLGTGEAMRRVGERIKGQGITRPEAAEIFKTGKIRMAGDPGLARRATQFLGANKGALRGLAVLSAVLSGAQEFNDDEGIGVNTSQAVGRGATELATTAGLAALGTAIMPGIGTVALPALAGTLGLTGKIGDAGAGAGAGLYRAGEGLIDAITGNDREKRELVRQLQLDELRNSSQTRQQVENMKAIGPILNDLRAAEEAANLQSFQRQQEILRNTNKANMTNAMALQQQQNIANTQAALTAYLMN